MTPIISGPSRQRVIRTTVVTLMVCGFAAAFIRDGHGGYARKNLHDLLASLGEPADRAIRVDPTLTTVEGVARAKRIAEFTSADASQLRSTLGEPALARGDEWYYVGPAGWLKVGLRQGAPAHAEWVAAKKSETDIQWQRWIGYALAAFAAVLLFHTVRVLTRRVRLDDSGLQIPGYQPVPLSALTVVRADDFQRTGRARIEMQVGGQTSIAVLDDYAVNDLGAIVAAICRERGWPDPIHRSSQQ